MHNSPETVDVLVVGAGPSGLTAAAALAREGIRVLAVDRHPSTSVFPKATGIRLRTMEILRSWGLADRLPEPDRDVRLAMSVSSTLADERYEEVPLGIPSAAAVRAVSPARFAFCAQDELEPVLLEQVLTSGGEVRFSTEVVGLHLTDNGASAVLRTVGSHGEAEQVLVQAAYVVGADGGSSMVRRTAGIGWRSLGLEGHHLAVLFRADLSAAVRDRSYVLHTTLAQEGQGRFVATGRSDRWVFDQEWEPQAGAVPTDRLVNTIRAASGLDDLSPRIENVFPWTFGAAAAESYRAGRVFLVGDAAHLTTPRGAVGMNTGIADAHNLGWKLAWVLKGWADPTLLDSYDAERRPVGLRNALRSLEPASPSTRDDDLLGDDVAVSYRSAVIAAGSPASPVAGAQAGTRAPHGWVERDGRRHSMLDLYDGRLTVVTGPEGRAWGRGADALAARGRPVRLVVLGRDVSDPGGSVAARYRLGPAGAVLVRPDGHVAWRSPGGGVVGGADDASGLLGAAGEAALGLRRSFTETGRERPDGVPSGAGHRDRWRARAKQNNP